MKRVFILLALILGGLRGLTQITIDQTDMPNPGDTLRVSISNIIPGDYTKTGMDTTWDFSGLVPLNQQLDTFVSKQSTPLAFQFFFSNANLASPGGVPSFPGLPVSSPFTYYEKAAGFFEDLGFAFNISFSGLALPTIARYDTADKYYAFPLTTGTTWNSNSSVSLSFTGLASYYRSRVRTNIVDGWGTVITPWGNFECIRIKSHLIQKDSIYLDTAGMGIPIIQDITQYKWLAKGKSIPVLQINQQGSLATAIYRDFYRQPVHPLVVDVGPDTAVYKGSTITIHAEATGGTPPYTYIWSNLQITPSITVTVDTISRYSVAVIDAINSAGFGSKLVSIKFHPGIEEKSYKSLKVYPNPATGLCKLKLSTLTHPVNLQIMTAQGVIRKEIMIDPVPNATLELNLSDLPSGLYILQLLNDQTWYRGKLVLQSATN
jgi:hypothetical protein